MSEWTVDTLKELIERIFDERSKALDAALMAVKEENGKTETAAEKRFELLNELRDGVATKEQFFALEKTVQGLETKQAIVDSKAESWLVWVGLFFTGASFFFSIVGIALTVISILITVYVVFLKPI